MQLKGCPGSSFGGSPLCREVGSVCSLVSDVRHYRKWFQASVEHAIRVHGLALIAQMLQGPLSSHWWRDSSCGGPTRLCTRW